MARIARVGDDVTVHLGVWEKIAGLHGDLRFPASAITAVEVDHDPLSSVRGMRAPGLHVPGRVKIGTWRRSGRKTFAVARRSTPAVRLDLTGQPYDRMGISVADAATAANSLR